MANQATREELMAQLRDLPAKLEDALNGLVDEQLDASESEGEWSIRQVVHHLADAHINAFVRTKLILTEDNPALKVWEQERWAVLPDTTKQPVQPSLLILRGVHARWSALLETLPEDSWKRTGVHPESGVLRLDDILRTYAGHGENHLRQIARARAANNL